MLFMRGSGSASHPLQLKIFLSGCSITAVLILWVICIIEKRSDSVWANNTDIVMDMYVRETQYFILIPLQFVHMISSVVLWL